MKAQKQYQKEKVILEENNNSLTTKLKVNEEKLAKKDRDLIARTAQLQRLDADKEQVAKEKKELEMAKAHLEVQKLAFEGRKERAETDRQNLEREKQEVLLRRKQWTERFNNFGSRTRRSKLLRWSWRIGRRLGGSKERARFQVP